MANRMLQSGLGDECDLTHERPFPTEVPMRDRLRLSVILGLALLSFLAPLKFTLPVIFYSMQVWPAHEWEWLLASWPETLFYLFLLPLFFLGVFCMEPADRRARWMLIPAFFAAGQFLSALGSTHPILSLHTLSLMGSIVAGFWLGGAFIRSDHHLRWILLAWVLASFLVSWKGISDATGGLEETRHYLEEHPSLAADNPELWHKIQSNRIFSTFVYPNALGGFLICAIFMVAAWSFLPGKGTRPFQLIRGSFAVAAIMGMLYCLWKSGSKGAYAAFIATLGLGIVTGFKRWKWIFMACSLLLLAAGGVFAVGYGRPALEMGKSTLEARIDYWKAALQIGWDHPLLGTGPGTFGKLYTKYKTKDAENTRLAHNTYLQMWSDSGCVGLLTFLAFLPGTLIRVARAHCHKKTVVVRSVWCAGVAFALHSLVDFDFYMVGNVWPLFVLLGYLERGARQASLPPSAD